MGTCMHVLKRISWAFGVYFPITDISGSVIYFLIKQSSWPWLFVSFFDSAWRTLGLHKRARGGDAQQLWCQSCDGVWLSIGECRWSSCSQLTLAKSSTTLRNNHPNFSRKESANCYHPGMYDWWLSLMVRCRVWQGIFLLLTVLLSLMKATIK